MGDDENAAERRLGGPYVKRLRMHDAKVRWMDAPVILAVDEELVEDLLALRPPAADRAW